MRWAWAEKVTDFASNNSADGTVLGSETSEALTPGEMVPYVVSEFAFIPDGIALDAEGRVYVTDALTNGIVRVEPDGTIVPIGDGVEQGFDTPTSMAFVVGATELTMYAVNIADQTYVPNDKPGPALIAIDVDTPGQPLPEAT